ncbi:MAG: hypothetical protein A2511_01370 [Deltaproteobacteria bacterium RIFOXYD12_FULL_50_9]|nr:MAG: hypothetical protein A2511_01370 [Deltaproteobacteria bacterium RIFOXYD12_FULL_50_9]
MEEKDLLKEMAAKWPSSIVARRKVGEFTGGVISEKSMANLDCLGQGPSNRIKIGKIVAYPVKDFIAWLVERFQRV